jgi:adenylosuccinate synthase
MQPKAVIGLGFGDEGKGRVVDELCRTSEGIPRVVRFNGGHQAAHHVVLEDGTDHVFAHFGSGTLQGAPTYWSKYCPVSPTALINEYNLLVGKTITKGIAPVLHIDREAPLTTPWERRRNQKEDAYAQHGSCGVGIHATFRREALGHHIWFEDLYHPGILRDKMRLLENYALYGGIDRPEEELDRFYQDCQRLVEMSRIHLGESVHEFEAFPHIEYHPGVQMIFEGAQGLMLDSKFGFYPHVTPSRTGTHNLMELRQFDVDLYLVTRAYATRHGAGPFVPFEGEMSLKTNPWEQNKDGGMQGKFRTGPLSLDHLRYAVNKDPYIRNHVQDATLVVTCADQIEEGGCFVSENGHLLSFGHVGLLASFLANNLGVKRVLVSNCAHGEIQPLV